MGQSASIAGSTEDWNLMQVASMPRLRTLLRTASGLDGASAAEREWAHRQLEWMHQQILAEKGALSRTFTMLVGIFWGLSTWAVIRQPKQREQWAMLPITAIFPIGIYLRIWVCNWLLHEYWAARE